MKLLIPAFAFALSLHPLRAQEDDPLAKLQATYEKEVAKVVAPVDRQYHQALLQLQKTFIEANELEKALEVKQEIDALVKKATDRTAALETAKSGASEVAGEMTEPSETSDDLRKWSGDQKRRKDDGKDALLLEGVLGGTRKMSREIEVGKDYPNGLRVRFKYKSEGLPDGGLEIRGVHSNNAFTYRNPTLELDGKWHEYEWPFRDYKGDSKITFEFHLENTEGVILLREIEFLDP